MKSYVSKLQEIIGDEQYAKFLADMSKKYEGADIVEFGEKIINKCAELIVCVGKSDNIKMDTVGLCFGDKVINVNCKEFVKNKS